MTPAMIDVEARRLHDESDYVQQLRIRCRTLGHEIHSMELQYHDVVIRLEAEKAERIRATFEPGLAELNRLLETLEHEVREREVVQWEAEMAIARQANVKRLHKPRDYTVEVFLIGVLATSLWFLFH